VTYLKQFLIGDKLNVFDVVSKGLRRKIWSQVWEVQAEKLDLSMRKMRVIQAVRSRFAGLMRS
jgi:hypothetical protein